MKSRKDILWWVALLATISIAACNDNTAQSSSEDLDPNRGLIGSVGAPMVFRFDNPTQDLEGWSTHSPHAWRVEDGSLVAENAYNGTLWLDAPIPAAARVEFDAKADKDGAFRIEIFGDGETHESGYVLVYNAWSGVAHLIGRLDEHEIDRVFITPSEALDPQHTYRMAIVRTDASLRWFVDGKLLLEYRDPAPLVGEGHNHLGLSNWSGRVRYDNVQVFDLGGEVLP